MRNRFQIKTIPVDDLHYFLSIKNLNFDLPKLRDIFESTLETCFDQKDVSHTNVIHACYDTKKEKYCAILNLGTTTAIDDLVSINIEFLFIKKEYRGKIFKEINDMKLSKFLLIAYVAMNIGLIAKDNFGISILTITPINEKVRKTYEDLNFITIDGSGSKKEEDWMIYYI